MRTEAHESDGRGEPFGSRYARALEYAAHWHSGQTRKGTSIPYICHPLAVSASVIEAGGDEDLAIAGLLHDVAEDCGGEARLTEIKDLFGERVEHIVRACSDSLASDPTQKAPWRERKEQHLADLALADDDVIVVSAADKLNNSRSLVTDLHLHGTSAMDRFNAPPDQISWYYASVLDVLTSQGAPGILLDPLRIAVEELIRTVEEIDSGRGGSLL